MKKRQKIFRLRRNKGGAVDSIYTDVWPLS